MMIDEDDDLVGIVTPLTKQSRPRVEYLMRALRHIEAKQVPGDIVECGVWRGASLVLARVLCPTRMCWGFDTFDGMPPPTVEDTKRDGTPASASYARKTREGRKWAAATEREVEENLRQLGLLDRHKVRLVAGKVEETLPDADELPDEIALLHLDTDWFASTQVELEVLYPRLVPGGVLIIDDFGHWMGARKAFVEYFAGALPRFDQIDYSGIGMIKP